MECLSAKLSCRSRTSDARLIHRNYGSNSKPPKKLSETPGANNFETTGTRVEAFITYRAWSSEATDRENATCNIAIIKTWKVETVLEALRNALNASDEYLDERVFHNFCQCVEETVKAI